jgi:hypothetical protein
MSYNHGKESKIFEEKWKKLRKESREAGMTDEAIDEIQKTANKERQPYVLRICV